jgi:uncharacterized membrane protein HdeD (DUF308 family)
LDFFIFGPNLSIWSAPVHSIFVLTTTGFKNAIMNTNLNTACETTAGLLTRHWWLLTLRGVAAISFGVLAFLWPGITLLTLVIFFGAYALVNGVLSFILATKTSRNFPRFTGLILPGLISIAAGLVAFFTPGLTALTLVIVIGSWSIVNGVMEIVEAVRLRKEISNEWLLVLAGIAGILFGVAFLIWPGAGAVVLVWWVASFAIFFGILLIAASFRLRHFRNLLPMAPA